MSLRAFDAYLTKPVAKLPGYFSKPFRALGILTSPLAWAVYIIGLLITRPDDAVGLLVVLLALPLAGIIKFAFRRERPPTIYAGNMIVRSYSFPSSHSYASALGATYLGLLALSSNFVVLGGCLLVLPLFVGVSRVYLGAHYPSDVLAGLLFGMAVAIGLEAWL